MSNDATHWAWHQNVSSASERLVLLSMAERAGEEHCCWPSVARLELDTKLNRKTIFGCINKLISQGLLFDTGKRKGRTASVKVYQLIGVNGREEQRKSSPKIGTTKQSQNRGKLDDQKPGQLKIQAVPILPSSRPKSGTTKQYQNRDIEPVNLEPIKEPIKINNKKNHKQLDFRNLPSGVSEAGARAFADHRKALKVPLTQHGFELSMREAAKSVDIGITPDEVIDETIQAGWRGINIKWLENRIRPGSNGNANSNRVNYSAKLSTVDRANREAEEYLETLRREARNTGCNDHLVATYG